MYVQWWNLPANFSIKVPITVQFSKFALTEKQIMLNNDVHKIGKLHSDIFFWICNSSEYQFTSNQNTRHQLVIYNNYHTAKFSSSPISAIFFFNLLLTENSSEESFFFGAGNCIGGSIRSRLLVGASTGLWVG